MQTYKRKVPVVEAWQFTSDPPPEVMLWTGGVLKRGPVGLDYLVLTERGGPTRITRGDWVVRNDSGQFEKWSDFAFQRTWQLQGHYDAADWMGGLCLVCERTPVNIMHTHTEDERRVARERTRTHLHRKLNVQESA